MDDWGDWSGGASKQDTGVNAKKDNGSKPDTGGWDTEPNNASKSGTGDDWGGGGGASSGGWGDSGGGGGWGDSGSGGRGDRGSRGGRGGGGGDRGCFNCGESGHMSRDCTAPRKERNNDNGGGGRSCYNCGESGHMSRDCPAPKKERGTDSGGGGGRSCYNCGESGHMSRDCTAPRKQGGSSNRQSGGAGGWGGNSANNDSKSGGDGGWGGGNDATKSSGDDGWGSGSGNASSKSGGGDAGGWGGGGSKDNGDSGGWADTNDKGPKPATGGDGDAERPAPYRPDELNLDEEAKLQVDNVGENFKRYKEQKVTCIPPNAIQPIEKFEDVIESKLLLDNVKSLRYTEMTPIQKWAMPALVDGYDLIGCAQTGSGKTAAFLLPILQAIMKTDLGEHNPDDDCQHPHCIIISPTRELAKQIYTQSKILSKDSLVKSCYIYGQIQTSHLKAQLSRGCHILVATLGRLKDFVQRGWIGFKNTKYVILDEGDRLVDDGFSGDLKTIFEHETMPPKKERQTLFFSATFKKQVQLTAKEFLKDEFIFITVGRVGAANEDIKQEFLQASRADKKRELRKILNEVPETDKTIIFTQTKAAADMLAGFFNSLKLSATSIHGDRHQSQREEAINLFKRGDKRFLISSPVGNRGLDLPKVSLVINYDLPDNIDEYVHRIGRTGRAGHTGRAISFFDAERDMEVVPELLKILEEAKQEIPSWLQEIGNPGSSSGFGDNNSVSAQVNDNGDDWGAANSTEPPATAQQTGAPSNDADEDWGGSGSNTATTQPSETTSGVETGSSSNKRQATDEAGGPQKKVELLPEPKFEEEW